jgi:cell division transport system permease protein
MSLKSDTRASIGISSIWNEGSGLDRISILALSSHCIRQTWENVRRSSLTSILTVVTISVAIFLLGLFFLVVHNASRAVSTGGGDMSVMVFLKDVASASDIESLSMQIRQIAPEREVTYFDKGQALQRFRASLGDDAKILEGLDADNPLPASLR